MYNWLFWYTGCGSIPYITNGKITHTGRANIGSTAEVRCDAGYKASKSLVSCQRSGDWEMTECLLIGKYISIMIINNNFNNFTFSTWTFHLENG
jgi:hypothetical protein